MSPPSTLHRRPSGEKGLRPLLLSPPPVHLPPEPTETLRPLSISLSQPRRPDTATDAVSLEQCSSSSTLPLFPGPADHQRGNTSFRTVFCRGCNPALSAAAILVSTTLCITLLPAWIGFRVLKDESGTHPPFWYLTLVGAFMSLAIGLVFACVVGLRARHSQDSGLTFLREDWAARVAMAGCLVLGVFALPLGMAVFGRASAYRAVDGMMVEVVGLGILFVLGVGGAAGYVVWHSVHGEWRRRKLLIGYKY